MPKQSSFDKPKKETAEFKTMRLPTPAGQVSEKKKRELNRETEKLKWDRLSSGPHSKLCMLRMRLRKARLRRDTSGEKNNDWEKHSPGELRAGQMLGDCVVLTARAEPP